MNMARVISWALNQTNILEGSQPMMATAKAGILRHGGRCG